MQSLNEYILKQFEQILLPFGINIVSDPNYSRYSADTDFIIITNYEKSGTLLVNSIEKKVNTNRKKMGLTINLDIEFGKINRSFSIEYYPDENGSMLRTLFSSLKKDLEIWSKKYNG